MKRLKVGDLVKIITPIAKFSYVGSIDDTITTRDSTSLKDGMVGRKAMVIYASDTYPQIIKVKVTTHKFYVSEFTGWEFRKKYITNFEVQKIICK